MIRKISSHGNFIIFTNTTLPKSLTLKIPNQIVSFKEFYELLSRTSDHELVCTYFSCPLNIFLSDDTERILATKASENCLQNINYEGFSMMQVYILHFV